MKSPSDLSARQAAQRIVLAAVVGMGVYVACWFDSAATEAARIPGSTDPMPIGVTAQLTLDGLVYADAKGMTLYWDDFDHDPGVSTCDNTAITTAYNGLTRFGYPLPYPYEGTQRRSCTQKWPPFEPNSNAAPVGKWAISIRNDGRRQWAYEGRPVYKSIVDKLPSEVSATETRIRARRPLYAPLHAPDGIKLTKTVLGLGLADPKGYVLYAYSHDTKDRSMCDRACARLWPPIIAAAGSLPEGDWSFVRRDDGQRQLAYRGQPLYRYLADEAPADADGRNVAGWYPVILLPVPRPPEEIRIATTPQGQIYVDRNGMSIYQFTCNEENDEHLSCDREGDTGAYFNGLCGGKARCADTFRLIKVTDPNAMDNTLWSIRSVDPSDPLRKLTNENEGVKVWVYNRRLVFTYSGDSVPGDIYAHGIRQLILAEIDLLRAYGAPDQR